MIRRKIVLNFSIAVNEQYVYKAGSYQVFGEKIQILTISALKKMRIKHFGVVRKSWKSKQGIEQRIWWSRFCLMDWAKNTILTKSVSYVILDYCRATIS